MTTKTQDVHAEITIGDNTFSPTSLTMNLTGNRAANHLKAKGFMDVPQALELDQDVVLFINHMRVFEGNLKEATETEKGVITIQAYDVLVDTYMKRVVLQTEQLRRGTEVARDLLQEAGIPHDIAHSSEFLFDVPKGKYRYGSGRAGEPLGNVLHSIADRIGGVIYVDKQNVLHLVPSVEHDRWVPKYIIKSSAGMSESKKTKVLVNSESSVTESGQAAAWMISQFSSQGQAEFTDDKDMKKENLKTLNEPNIVTQNEANTRAVSELFGEAMNETAGSITIVGDPRVRPWDNITMPFIPDSIISRELFTIGSVTHTIDMGSGYTTKIDLQPDTIRSLELINGDGNTVSSWRKNWKAARPDNAKTLELFSA